MTEKLYKLITIGTLKSNPDGQIIFVHGLGGDFNDTWEILSKEEYKKYGEPITTINSNDVQKGSLVHSFVHDNDYKNNYNIFSFDYETLTTRNVEDISNDIAESLKAENSKIKLDKKTIIISHSLGGILTKLIINKLSEDKKIKQPIQDNIKIAFFGVPHFGSILGSFYKNMETFLAMLCVLGWYGFIIFDKKNLILLTCAIIPLLSLRGNYSNRSKIMNVAINLGTDNKIIAILILGIIFDLFNITIFPYLKLYNLIKIYYVLLSTILLRSLYESRKIIKSLLLNWKFKLLFYSISLLILMNLFLAKKTAILSYIFIAEGIFLFPHILLNFMQNIMLLFNESELRSFDSKFANIFQKYRNFFSINDEIVPPESATMNNIKNATKIEGTHTSMIKRLDEEKTEERYKKLKEWLKK